MRRLSEVLSGGFLPELAKAVHLTLTVVFQRIKD